MLDETTTAAPAPIAKPTRILRGPDIKGWYWGTGRRKTAVARVRMKGGTGDIEINGKPFAEFFVEERDRQNILAVLDKTGLKGQGRCEGQRLRRWHDRPDWCNPARPRSCGSQLRPNARTNPARARLPHA